MILSAGVGLLILAVLIRTMARRAGQGSIPASAPIVALLVVVGVIGYAVFYRISVQEQAADRRAIEARTAELTSRSLAPGSVLGCLDAVASSVVENACERPLFATPEAVAAAVDYVDARFSLLAASAVLAQRDPAFQPAFERLRRGLETDRYGLVAHVLITRGCGGPDCPELRLLRDPSRVVANMKARTFEAALGVHALSWPSNGASPAVASVPPAVTLSPVTTSGAGTPAASGGSGHPVSSRFDFPSASSIPAVSIMNPEPVGPPPAAEPRPSQPAPKRTASQPARRQSAREVAPPPPQSAPQPAPQPAPVQAAPEVEPEAPPQTRDQHSTR